MEIQQAIEIMENYAPGRDMDWSEMREAVICTISALQHQCECKCGAEETNDCKWCNSERFSRFECNRIDAEGHTETCNHMVVSFIALYCPVCGKKLEASQ